LKKHLPGCSSKASKKQADAAAKKPVKPPTLKAISTAKPQSIKGFLSSNKKWKYDDPQSIALDLKILRWMCLNCKPLSEVDKPGFADIFTDSIEGYDINYRWHFNYFTLGTLLKAVRT